MDLANRLLFFVAELYYTQICWNSCCTVPTEHVLRRMCLSSVWQCIPIFSLLC